MKNRFVSLCDDIVGFFSKLGQRLFSLKISFPAISFPSVRLPRIPKPNLPKPKYPRLKLPNPTFPKLEFPKFSLPKISFPKISFPRFKAPRVPRLSTDGIAYAAMILAVLFFIVSLGDNPSSAREEQPAERMADKSVISGLDADELNALSPAADIVEPEPMQDPAYALEESTLDAEAVLVPQKVTVISSSRDGKIAEIPLYNGDTFKAGDVLLRYDCRDLEAEANIVSLEKDLSGKKAEGSYKLFKLDLVSDVDHMRFVSDHEKTKAQEKLYEARLESCVIRAEFDGRVTNRLANPGEFTRTDRVLLEVASLNPMNAEFLVPSKWLRWINVGAPLSITISETGNRYDAEIIRIYGEIDPVSQSIQVVARIDGEEDILLPGMSGEAVLNAREIRNAGVTGFLERKISQAK